MSKKSKKFLILLLFFSIITFLLRFSFINIKVYENKKKLKDIIDHEKLRVEYWVKQEEDARYDVWKKQFKNEFIEMKLWHIGRIGELSKKITAVPETIDIEKERSVE